MSDKARITEQLRVLGCFCLICSLVAALNIAIVIWPNFLLPLALFCAWSAFEIIRASIEVARLIRLLGHIPCPGCGLQFGIQAAKKSRSEGEDVWTVICGQCNCSAYFDTQEETLIDPAKEEQQVRKTIDLQS